MDVRKEYFRLKEESMRNTGESRARADEALECFLNGLSEADKEVVFKAIEEDLASLHQTAHEASELKEKIALRKQLEHEKPAEFTEAELKILADSIGDLGQRLSALSNVIHRSL